MRLVTDIFEFCARELPRWNTISISGYHMREAGATAAQELAFTLADAIAYVRGGRRARARRSTTSRRGSRSSSPPGRELFEEVAKFRAARRMWARIVRDRFGATSARSMTCRFHVQTAGSSLTAQSIDNNVVRTTVQALAAVLGGAQSLHTNARDEALALPTEESARLALRTQQILAYESGVTETPDPLAGSYFVEIADRRSSRRRPRTTSTRSTRWAARSRRSRAASSSARSRSRPTASSAAIERGDLVVVGVNKYRDDAAAAAPPTPADRPGRRAAPDRAGPARPGRARPGRVGGGARAGSRTRPPATENLLPALIEAVKAYATVGEISDRLRAAWGEHRELITV